MAEIPVGINEALLVAKIQAEVSPALVEALKVVAEECKKTVPIESGELRDSIHTEGPVWFSPYYAEGRVVAGSKDIPQAHFQEFGTDMDKKDHSHKAKGNYPMHFFWKGVEIYAWKVRGCIPLRWMSRAIDLALPLVDRIFQALQIRTQGFIITHTVKGPTR